MKSPYTIGHSRGVADLAGEAAAQLRAEARAGRLDAGAAAAVLSAAGHAGTRRPARPADLTGRETEVLQLLARGLSNKEIAERLVISRKTVGHHVEHIYAKTGTANRALASLFAANLGRRCSAATTRNATVTFSGSSRPVVRLTTALPFMPSPFGDPSLGMRMSRDGAPAQGQVPHLYAVLVRRSVTKRRRGSPC